MTILLLWAAFPLVSKWLCLEARFPSLHPISLNRSSPSSVLAGGFVQTQVPQAETLHFARLCGVSAQGRTVLLRGEHPPGLLRLGPSLGVPRSTEGDPLKKCTQKYVVLANSLVANETNRQPCPNKAFAGGQAVAGEVSLLCLFPFLRTTALKKKFQTEQPLPLCS